MLPVKNAPCRHLAPSRLVPQVPAWDIMHVGGTTSTSERASSGSVHCQSRRLKRSNSEHTHTKNISHYYWYCNELCPYFFIIPLLIKLALHNT